MTGGGGAKNLEFRAVGRVGYINFRFFNVMRLDAIKKTINVVREQKRSKALLVS